LCIPPNPNTVYVAPQGESPWGAPNKEPSGGVYKRSNRRPAANLGADSCSATGPRAANECAIDPQRPQHSLRVDVSAMAHCFVSAIRGVVGPGEARKKIVISRQTACVAFEQNDEGPAHHRPNRAAARFDHLSAKNTTSCTRCWSTFDAGRRGTRSLDKGRELARMVRHESAASYSADSALDPNNDRKVWLGPRVTFTCRKIRARPFDQGPSHACIATVTRPILDLFRRIRKYLLSGTRPGSASGKPLA